MTPEWKATLATSAAAVGVTLDPASLDALALFCDRLLEWNRKIDLTTITDPGAVREKHIVDSLAGVPLLRAGDRRLADLGSGGGFPGVVLAIVDRSRQVVSVESRTKKAVFQRQVARELKLTNLEVLDQRIEDLSIPRPDLLTARALADLDELIRLNEARLEEGAHLLVWKSSKVDEELRGAKARIARLGLVVLDRRDFALPESGEPRTLLRLGRS